MNEVTINNMGKQTHEKVLKNHNHKAQNILHI